MPSGLILSAVGAERRRPVEQVRVPVWQGLVGVQAPGVQVDADAGSLHTMLAPHIVPVARLPDSMQTDEPVAHEVAPVLQALVGWQLAPAEQVDARAGVADPVGAAT